MHMLFYPQPQSSSFPRDFHAVSFPWLTISMPADADCCVPGSSPPMRRVNSSSWCRDDNRTNPAASMKTVTSTEDSPCSSAAVQRFLSLTPLGKLQYDRDWERDGRAEEILSDINSRLMSISIAPKIESYDRISLPDHEYENRSYSEPTVKYDVPAAANAIGDEVEQSRHISQDDDSPLEKSLVEEKAKYFFEEVKWIEENENQEKCEREIRNRRLSRAPDDWMQTYRTTVDQITRQVLAKSPQSETSIVETRMRDFECRKLKLMQERELMRQKELQREVRALISAIDGEVRRTIKSLQESTTEIKSLKQHSKETGEFLKSLQMSIDSIACKTTFTDEDQQILCKAKAEITTACSQCLERTDALIFAHKQQQIQQQSSPAAQRSAAPVSEPSFTGNDRSATPALTGTLDESSGQSDILKEYIACRSFVAEFEKKIQPFIDDVGQKSYRQRLQRFIRTQINAISPESNDHLKQKFQKLQSLFDQQIIQFQDQRLTARDHPLALEFCLDYAAKTFLSVGSKQVLSVPKAAFSFAAIVALLWEREPRFGQLFMGHLLEKCPYIGAYYPTPDARESDADYLICCGYVFGADGKTLESEESFLNRMRSYVRIYGALLQSKARQEHGMRHAWIWLARTLRVEPKAGISAAIVHAFLDVCLHRVLDVYRSQCVKLLVFLSNDYIPRTERNSIQEVKKQSVVQLNIFVTDALDKIRKNKSVKHEGLLSDYFWQKSYLNS